MVRPSIAPSAVASPADAHISDSRRMTLRHINGVAQDIGSVQEPMAGPDIVSTAVTILEPTSTRLMSIEDVARKRHIETRVDGLLLDSTFKRITGMLSKDPKGGVTKDSALWQRELVYETLTELRSMKACIEIGRTNEAFESRDSIAAKTQASETSVEHKGLKVIGEGAGLSWGSRKMISQKAVQEEVNKASTNNTTGVSKTAPQGVVPKTTGTALADVPNRTPGAVCSFCGKGNHTDMQCHKKAQAQRAEKAAQADRAKRSRSRSRDRRRRDRPPSRRRHSRSRSPRPPNRPPLKEPKKERD